jgi:hypothetical protein
MIRNNLCVQACVHCGHLNPTRPHTKASKIWTAPIRAAFRLEIDSRPKEGV